MSTLILSAYRISKKVDLFKEFLEPTVTLAYESFKKSDFIGILHQMILVEAEEKIEENLRYYGIVNGNAIDTYHELKNKLDKASVKKVAGDPFDQNIKVMIKWDQDYYYIKFLVNGKLSSDILETIVKNFDFLEEFSYGTDDTTDDYRGVIWREILGKDSTFVNFLQFDIVSAERIEEWIMEPIFSLPAGKEWLYKFDKTTA